MVEVIPSILVKTKAELLDKLVIVEPFIQRVHLDVADGIFVSNLTAGAPTDLESIETGLKIGVHLMVSKPENHIVAWTQTAADKFIFHIEATSKPQAVIDSIREADGDRQIGIALNPRTPVTAVEPWLELIDFVHFMAVEPGFYGGEFLPAVLDKISDFHYFYPDKPIAVDGGVTPETAPKLVAAGATQLVAGSYIFTNHDVHKAIETLKQSVNA